MNPQSPYDLAILGGGPAGCSAAVYAARKKLKTVLITDTFGGQSVVSENIENWIGDIALPGPLLAKKLESHVRHYEGPEMMIEKNDRVEKVEKEDESFKITTNKSTYWSKTVLVTTGSHRKKLSVPGAAEFEHKGITYCASCDGPFFKDKDVVVIGGGNAGFESASQLLAYCKSVTLLQRSERYRAEATSVDTVLSHPNMTGILNARIKSVYGKKMVSGITYEKDGGLVDMPTDGVFIEIGAEPTTGYLEDLVKKNAGNYVIVDHRSQRSSHTGIWAAGDCTDALYHQNNIAAGDAVKALEDIYLYLKTN